MLTIEQAQQRVADLQAETQALEVNLREAEAHYAETCAKRDAAGIMAERTPTAQHTEQADQLEASAHTLESQIARKRVALQAARTDLATARADLQRANAAGVVVEIEEILAELTQIAAELERNLVEPQLWRRATEICQRGNLLYSQVRPADSHLGRAIFPDIALHTANRVLQRIGATIGAAVDLRGVRQHPVNYATVGDAMDLERLTREVAHLRKVHIGGTEERTEAREAVFA